MLLQLNILAQLLQVAITDPGKHTYVGTFVTSTPVLSLCVMLLYSKLLYVLYVIKIIRFIIKCK